MNNLNISPNDLQIRSMSRDEFDILITWAAKEGWNPGKYDADIFWDTDPNGFVAAEINGKLVGGGSIISYSGKFGFMGFGFMGFFIILPEYRGHKLGRKLAISLQKMMISRLSSKVSIGIDGVFDMQEFYRSGGFEFSHREFRFTGIGGTSLPSEKVIKLSHMPFDIIHEYDTAHFPCERENFLKNWIKQPESLAVGILDNNKLAGYGVIRKCLEGFKIGPLFADNAEYATEIFNTLTNYAKNEIYYIDVPENNDNAMKLVKDNKLAEVFGCARMYYGHTPKLPYNNIYALTTFELG